MVVLKQSSSPSFPSPVASQTFIMTKSQFLLAFLAVVSTNVVSALIPLIDGGKGMPKIYGE